MVVTGFESRDNYFIGSHRGCLEEILFQILIIAALSGVIGTGIGGAAGTFCRPRTGAGAGIALAFASGIMTGLVFFSIIPESLELAGIPVFCAALLAGGLLAFVSNLALDRSSGTPHSHLPDYHPHEADAGTGSGIRAGKSKHSGNTAFILASAIALHNLPDGLALGSGAELDLKLGIIWAVLIALHNIPIGLAIGITSVAEGKSRLRGILSASVSGLPMVIGAAIGAAVGNAGELFLGAVFAVSGGALLYVDFCEIIPQVIRGGKNIRTGFVILLGIITTLLTVYLLH
jgi:ZIP family zinc transporter